MSQSHGLIRAVRSLDRASLLALGLCIAALWISIPLGEWRIGVFVAVGVALGLVNHFLTELFLVQSVHSSDLITRKQYAISSLVRLLGVSLVAAVLAITFWPDGATVLLGLALFHLITLVLTGIPLLKEITRA